MPKKTMRRYNPFERYEWLAYVESDSGDDAIPIEVEVRANLTFGELEGLVWEKDAAPEDVWPLIAPFVRDWNISGLDEEGNEIEIPAPAVGGPEQFRFIPPALFWELVRDLKLRSTRPLDRKRLSASSSTAETLSSSD